MGRRGPTPEPAGVKLQKGNTGHRPIGADPEPTALEGQASSAPAGVEPPAWLKNDGLEIWERMAPRLAAMKLLTQLDADAFGRYCRNYARWLKMQGVLDNEGETYESDSNHGKLKRAHPAYLIGDRLERSLSSAEANFGLNPAERQRIFAARAAGAFGDRDLFGNPVGKKDKPAPGAAPAEPTPPPVSAVGYLN